MADAHAHSLLYLVKQVELAIKASLDEVVAPFGLTSNQYTALTVLHRNPGITAARLARNSFVRIQSMAQLVEALEDRGLIQRERDEHNKRQNLISITEEGERVLDALAEPVAALEAQVIEGLDDAEVVEFISTLRHIRHAFGGSHAH